MARPADIFVDIEAHIASGRFIRANSINKRDIRDFTFSGVDLGQCRNVLDLGCAYGFFTRGLAGRLHPDAHLIGVDLWRGCEEHFISACRESGYTGEFRLADKTLCERYPDESFDLVLCSYTLYFFPQAVPDIVRVLRPEGFFITVTHTAPHMGELVDIVKRLLEKQAGCPVSSLPLEELFKSFSSTNGRELLSPWFQEIKEKQYENALRITNDSLTGLIDYLCFKRPLFFPAEHAVTDRFIRTTVADYFRRLLAGREYLIITKSDTIYSCSQPRKTRVTGIMRKKKKKYCPYCRAKVEQKMEGGIRREYCPSCGVYFYENPLPVVSAILVKDRQVLLVKRANNPYRGKWCLPSGFAETGESVSEAALRELEEETGVKAKVVQLQDVDSCLNYFYGDLLFLTFEVDQVGGEPKAGDDAAEVRFFPLTKLPRLAFPSNTKALQVYIEEKKDYWAIIDSFSLAAEGEDLAEKRENLLSNKLVELIEEHSNRIARLWMEEVTTSRSTPTYQVFDQEQLFHRVFLVISHFGQWLSGSYHGQDIITYYTNLGWARRQEGFALSEVVSALSLIKKHIWEFALSRGMWSRTIDIYMIMELERRISFFFDKATFYVAKGYEM